jgi:ribulose-phosphate 3-epimerase
MGSQTEFVERVQGEGLRVGVGIDLDTPVNKVEQSLFGLVDVILVMSVKAGFGGQEFDKSALSKIEELVNIRTEQKSAFRICVDGGVKEEVMKEVSLAGADEVSIGRRLFQGDIAANIKRLKELSS